MRRWSDILFLAMVAVLPLHTVFFTAWISWKPFLVILVGLVLFDAWDGIRTRRWPWHRRVTLAVLPFLAVITAGFPEPAYREKFIRLSLAILVGLAVLLVSERRLRDQRLAGRSLRVVFWSAAAMGLTAVLTSLVALGVFGGSTIGAVNDVPGIFRVSKPAYLDSGFLALTNWHQDPGYGAAWATLWATLALIAALKGFGSGRRWLDGVVVGGLGYWVVMAFSRTGWVAYAVALLLVTVVFVRRGGLRFREVGTRISVALATITLLLAGALALDVEEVGGDLDLQFAFRFSQGWDLLADITGLFDRSDSTAFADRFDVSEERADVWPEYLEMFQENPVLGVGLGVGWETNSIRQEPHNLLLQLLAETGLVGAVAYALLLGTILVAGAGITGGVALFVTFLPSITQTVLFEPAWWFAAALYLAGVGIGEGPKELSEIRVVVE